ncbi:MAG: hypothetical protein ABEN55_21125 [Bradymonadaceae bacterium]
MNIPDIETLRNFIWERFLKQAEKKDLLDLLDSLGLKEEALEEDVITREWVFTITRDGCTEGVYGPFGSKEEACKQALLSIPDILDTPNPHQLISDHLVRLKALDRYNVALQENHGMPSLVIDVLPIGRA